MATGAMAKKTKEEEELEAAMDPWAPKEREVTLSEIENRLRDMILKILKPSMERASNLSGALEDLKQMVRKHDDWLSEVEVLKLQCQQQSEMTKVFESELENMNKVTQKLEEKMMQDQNATKTEMRDVRANMDKKSAMILHINREAERLWEEASRLQKQHDEQKKGSDDRFDHLRSISTQQKEEIMETIFEITANHSKLYEDVWSDEHGLNHLADEIRKVDKTLDQLPAIQEKLKNHSKAIDTVEENMIQNTKFVKTAKTENDDLREIFEENVASLRTDFREVSSTLSAHHAAMAKGMRESYKEEIKHVASLRGDAARFMKETDKRVAEVEAQMTSADNHIQHLHKEIVKDIEEVNRKRKRDRLNLDGQIKESVKDVNDVKDQFKTFTQGIEHISSVMNIMLEGERVESALSIQDYVDRRQGGHLACKGDLDQPLKPEHGTQGMLNVCHQVIHEDENVDIRKGLRKAPYTPGSVSYGESLYERHDLLLIRDKLVVKAQEALRHGPQDEKKQPSFKAVVTPPRSKDSDGFKSRGKSGSLQGSLQGSGQRPGSQQQPHAGGSRGRVFGSLNESEPVKSSEPVKLPIIKDNGTVASINPKHPRSLGGSLTAR